MNTLQNLHTHTTYGDGNDTPEQLVRAALDKGFGGIGFSGHSYMYYAPRYSMSPESTEAYKKEIVRLKQKYKGTIDVFLGLEFDAFSGVDQSGYEYLIGSMHYLKLGGEIVGFDRPLEVTKQVVDTYFGGDGMAFAKEYYRQIAHLPEYGNFDIIGHFDLLTKHVETVKFFDIESKEYLQCAFEAIEALSGKIPLFEVNTGAVARGYRTAPYPHKALMKRFRELGFGVVITSDCHDARLLDFGFDLSRSLLWEAGFREQYILTDSGFRVVPLME